MRQLRNSMHAASRSIDSAGANEGRASPDINGHDNYDDVDHQAGEMLAPLASGHDEDRCNLVSFVPQSIPAAAMIRQRNTLDGTAGRLKPAGTGGRVASAACCGLAMRRMKNS
jgi:hypothetical protein